MENCEISNNKKEDIELNELCDNIKSIKITEKEDNKCIINISQIIKTENQNDNISQSMCEIKLDTYNETIKGLGFLLKFWINHEIFYCLISNDNIIKKEIISNNNIISIYFNNELKS